MEIHFHNSNLFNILMLFYVQIPSNRLCCCVAWSSSFIITTKESTNLQIPSSVSVFTDHVHKEHLEISCLSWALLIFSFLLTISLVIYDHHNRITAENCLNSIEIREISIKTWNRWFKTHLQSHSLPDIPHGEHWLYFSWNA